MTLKKINHTFTHPQLSYDAQPKTQACIKLSFYFNKLPEVSFDQFYGHWSTVHADLAVAAKGFGLCKLQRYVQVCLITRLLPTISNPFWSLTNCTPGSSKARAQGESTRLDGRQCIAV
jgi:hypothetical protein